MGHRTPPTLNGKLLDIDAPEWAALLRASPHDFYHLPAYVALCAAEEAGRARALYVAEDGRAMLLPLVIRSIPGGGFDATSPYGYPGPIGTATEDPGFLEVALEAGVGTLREAGIVSAFVRLHPLLNPVPPAIGTVVRHGDTVSLDLTLTTEALSAQTRPNHRRDIARAKRLGYSARMDEDWRHYETFKALYRATMARHSAHRFYFFEDSYFDALRNALGGHLHLCVVHKDGVVVAAGMYTETKGIVQYHLSGTDDAFSQGNPTKLMMDFVRWWARERGNRVMHLGGGVGAANDSLLQFKAGFSPLRHTFATLRIVVDEQEYARLVAARDPAFDPAARGGYFPQYRQT